MPLHKVFISYHHADQTAVDNFVRTYDNERNGFITRGINQTFASKAISSSLLYHPNPSGMSSLVNVTTSVTSLP
jgi:hypothetical protein